MTQDKLKTKDDTKMYLGAVYQVSYMADRSRCYRQTACQTFYWNSSTKPKKKMNNIFLLRYLSHLYRFCHFLYHVEKNSRFRPPFRCVNFYSLSVHSATILLSRCILSLIYCHDYKLVLTSISVDSCKRQSYKLNMIV